MPSATGPGPVLRDVRGTAGPSPRLGLDPACCSLRTPSPLVERSMVSQFSGAGHPPASLSPTLSPGGTERPPGSLGGSLLLHPSPKFRFRDWGWGCQSVIHSLSISSHFLDVRPWDTMGKLPFSLLGASETPKGGSVSLRTMGGRTQAVGYTPVLRPVRSHLETSAREALSWACVLKVPALDLLLG